MRSPARGSSQKPSRRDRGVKPRNTDRLGYRIEPNRIQMTYEPRGGCLDLFSARDPEVLLSGPAGTGKSMACLHKLNAMMIKYPGARGLIVRKTQRSASSTTLVSFQQKVVEPLLRAHQLRLFKGSATEPAQFVYANGSVIVLAGMDNPNKIMSSEYDLIYVNEAVELTETDWEALSTRLRNGKVPWDRMQIIADTNPSHPTHWLKQRCDHGQTKLIETRHTDNPEYYDSKGELTEAGKAYTERRLDSLTGVRKLRLRDGKWVASEGVIYDEFDPALHVVDRFEIPQDWDRWWTVDFGYVHPFAWQCWAEDPDGGLWMYREILHTGRTVDVHARTMLDQVTDSEGQWTEPRPRAVICDHDAENRAVLERELGMSTRPARKQVTEGIQSVQRRLREGRLHLLRGSLVRRDPDLSDERRPTCLVEEISSYIWDTSGVNPREAPVKTGDDACDAMRYIVAERDLGGLPGVRWMSV